MGTHPIFESDFDCLTEMNRLVVANRTVLSRSIATSAVRAGGLPQKEQWILDWQDNVPGKHVMNMKSDHDGGKAGIWNAWRVAAVNQGWIGTAIGEFKFFLLIVIGFSTPWWLTKNGMTK